MRFLFTAFIHAKSIYILRLLYSYRLASFTTLYHFNRLINNIPYLTEQKPQSTQGSQTNGNVTGQIDTLKSCLMTTIPNQMSHTIPEMVDEWESDQSLDGIVNKGWETGEEAHDRCRIDWNTQNRGGGKRTSDSIESKCQVDTRKSMEGRHDSSQLLLVDG